MKEYVLIIWYPSLPAEWCLSNTSPIIVVEREDGYYLHPSLKASTKFAIIEKREVEGNQKFWKKIRKKDGK